MEDSKIFSEDDNVWYAANMTQIVVPPKQVLDAFGITKVKYFLVSEHLDNPQITHVREGFVYSQRPSILKPEQIDKEKLKGFGKQARENAHVVVQMDDMQRVVKYGLNFKKEEVKEQTINESITKVISTLEESIKASTGLTTLIIGDDNHWEISLLRFMVEYVQNSLPENIREFHANPRTASILNPGGTLQDEIEVDFINAKGNQEFINKLALKLRQNNLFERYEDRFFALLRKDDSASK